MTTMQDHNIKFSDIVEVTGLPRGRIDYVLRLEMFKEAAAPGGQGKHRRFGPGTATKVTLLALLVGYGHGAEHACWMANHITKRVQQIASTTPGRSKSKQDAVNDIHAWILNNKYLAVDLVKPSQQWSRLQLVDIQTHRTLKNEMTDPVWHVVDININRIYAEYVNRNLTIS